MIANTSHGQPIGGTMHQQAKQEEARYAFFVVAIVVLAAIFFAPAFVRGAA